MQSSTAYQPNLEERLSNALLMRCDPDSLCEVFGIEKDPEVIRARESFVDFMGYEGRGEWTRERHCEIICNKMQDVSEGRSRRVMFFLPPRHGKSEICSKKHPAWHLGGHPNDSIILSSYSADLALDFSQIARDTLEAEREIFPGVTVNQSSRAKKRWIIEGQRKGGVIAAGVGGPITGRGADIAIIDDPFKNHEEAQSETVRESVWNWYRSTLRTRLAPGGAIVLIMTRWHEDDLAGRLIAEMGAGTGEQWEIVEFPAIAEEDSDLLGRKKGDALSPRFPIEELMATKKAVGSYIFGALYQQHPRPEEGNFFKENWFVDAGHTINALLAKWERDRYFVPTYAAMDLAIGEREENDWNAIGAGILTPDNEKLLADVDRFKGDTFVIVAHIVDFLIKWKPLLFVFENEKILKTIWPLVLQEVKRRKLSINYEHLTRITDKVARARIVQGQMRGGEWIFPVSAPWYEDFKEEGLGFPNAKWDDQVDMFADLGRLLADNSFGDYDLS